MLSIGAVNQRQVEDLEARLKKGLAGVSYLDDAAQKLTDLVFDELQPSLALARVYVTVPYGRLPSTNKAFVDALAEAKQIKSSVKPETLVLSLVGTRGARPAWNDRRQSQGHVGIPLATASFVESIPMVSRLLVELGLGLDWVDKSDVGILARAAGDGVGGVFFVEDAATATDKKGRKIIPAQDFVAENGVKTVFGVGTTFVDGTLATMILFTREKLARTQADLFAPLMRAFKLATTMTAVVKKQLMQ